MLKRGTRTAWVPLAMAGAVAVSLLIVAGAGAAGNQIIAGDNSYDQNGGNYTIQQGERPTLQNVGVNSHDVWSRLNGPDGKKLFISPTIGGGATTVVNGTQYLTAGTYAFFCNVHPFEMSANLVVTNGGTPVPRPAIDVAILGRTIDKVLRKGRLAVRLQAQTQSDDVKLELRLGKKVIGSKANIDIGASTSKIMSINVTKAGKAKLAAKDKATVKLTGSVPFGPPDTAKKKLK
jgi:plastocyanin